MGLWAWTIWWAGVLMLACALWRLSRKEFGFRYRYFFFYLACVLLTEFVRLYLAKVDRTAYRTGYWISEFVCAMAGFGVTWEIYSHVLLAYRGLRRMARTILAGLVVVLIIRALTEAWRNPLQALIPSTIELERNLRVLQALVLLGLLLLIVNYAVPLGRNLWAMLVGYVLYIGSTVIALSLRSELGTNFQGMDALMQQLSWASALIIWCAGMWSYTPNPVPKSSLERYERISQQTIAALAQLRANVTQSWRL